MSACEGDPSQSYEEASKALAEFKAAVGCNVLSPPRLKDMAAMIRPQPRDVGGVALQFWGFEIVLSSDGTYYVNDTAD